MMDVIKRFQRDRRGTVAILFGMSAIVLFGTIGIAIDSSKVFAVKSEMTSALDASALAAAKLLDSDENATDDEIKQLAEDYFNAQLNGVELIDSAIQGFRAEVDRTTSTVTTTVDLSVKSIFGQLTNGTPNLQFTPSAEVSFKARKIELALVLDVTGSMLDGGKLAALKAAANDLVDGLYASNPDRNAVKVALVPYSASVNAGPYQGVLAGPAVAQASDSCVVERPGADAFSNAVPGGGRYSGIGSTAINASYSCPSSAITPLTPLHSYSEREDFKSEINALTADGATAGHIGLAIGWYMLSPEWGSIWPQPPRQYNPDRVIKAVILMTDGIFNTSYSGGGETYQNGDPRRTDPLAPGSSAYQALELCQNMAGGGAESIQIYTVAFQAPADSEAMLRACAGDGNFYTADTAGELVGVFENIAEMLTNLRLTG